MRIESKQKKDGSILEEDEVKIERKKGHIPIFLRRIRRQSSKTAIWITIK
jgi:hypothetical protein